MNKLSSLLLLVIGCLLFLTAVIINHLMIRDFIDLESDEDYFDYSYVSHQFKPLYHKVVSTLKDNHPYYDLEPKPTIILHISHPDCLCNIVSQRHKDDLFMLAERHDKKLKVISINQQPNQLAFPQPSAPEHHSPNSLHNEKTLSQLVPTDLPSLPTLVIYNPQGELNYFGPFGFGAFCNQPSDNPLTNIVIDIMNGQTHKQLNVTGEGCFCNGSRS